MTQVELPLVALLSVLVAGLAALSLRQTARARAMRAAHAEVAARLGASQERLHALLLSVPDTLITLDADERVLEMKPTETAGRMPSLLRLQDRTLSDMFPEPVADSMRAAIERARRRGRTELVEFPLRVARDQRWFEARAAAAGDGALLVVRDITERRVILEGLERAREAAEEAAHASGEFVAKMTHDLRNPLTSTLMLTERLLRDEQDPKRRRALQLMLESTRHQAALVSDMLDYSRAEAGKIELQPQAIDMRVLITDLVDVQRPRAESEDIDLTLEVRDGVPRELWADAQRLRRVFGNLIDNAIKFTPRGHVDVRVAYAGGELSFSVHDTGVGIPAAAIDTLFDPFVQAENQRGHAGTGLGLAVCKQLVELMAGTIQVESRPEAGTRFEVVLPLRPPESFKEDRAPAHPR